jgi:membrane fusion protein, multidrug efflux system
MKVKSFTLGTIALVILAGCSATTDNKAKLEKLKTEQSRIADDIKKLESEIAKTPGAETVKSKEISVSVLEPKPFEHHIQTQGFVESIENIQVSAKTAGIITQVFVVEGEQVSKGQMLGQIDNTLITRGMEEIKASLELANTVYTRQKNLWDQKIGTEVQYLQAKNNKESLERRLASLNEQYDMTRIKSPINGVVDEVTLRVGQNIAPGMPAARVVNNQDLKIKANVSEAYISKIKKGNKAVVTVSDLNKDIVANVTFVGRNINQLSRTFVVEVKLPSNQDLRPNMSVVLKVVYESFKNALVVPVNVIQNINDEKVVYVMEMDGKQAVARKKVVEVSGVFDNAAQITSGLKTGDQVIVVGYQGLNDGEFVKL